MNIEFYKQNFPNIKNNNFIITSENDDYYNCISWAYGMSEISLCPNRDRYYWPDNISNTEHINSFIELYKVIKYESCSDGILEDGYEKICIYEKDNIPTHASKQLQDGMWTSKMGIYNDVKHSVFALNGGLYGDITIYMKRKITNDIIKMVK